MELSKLSFPLFYSIYYMKKRYYHPKEMYLLAATEMCQRYAFWGISLLLVLYLVNFYDYSAAKATHVFGAFTGLSFLLPPLGGYVADRIGIKRGVILGMLFTAIGALFLATTLHFSLYLGLGFLALGDAFFTPSIYTLLGAVYADNHPKREGGFSIYYATVNIGMFSAMLSLGSLMHSHDWRTIFLVAASVQALGFLPLFKAFPTLPSPQISRIKTAPAIKTALKSFEKDRIKVLVILSFVSILFWIVYNQLGASLPLFITKYVDRNIASFTMPAPWIISFESLFLILLSFPLSALYSKMRQRKTNPNPITKTIYSFIFIALTFLLIAKGAALVPVQGKISPFYFVVAFLFMAIAELAIAPIGLSLVTHLSPRRYQAFLVGFWYLCLGVGLYLGGYFAGWLEKIDMTLFFQICAAIPLLGAAVLFCMSRYLNRLRHMSQP